MLLVTFSKYVETSIISELFVSFDLSIGTDFLVYLLIPGRVSHSFLSFVLCKSSSNLNIQLHFKNKGQKTNLFQISFNFFRNSSRPRAMRDFTVPIFISNTDAISS